jgi:hypothetical protein
VPGVFVFENDARQDAAVGILLGFSYIRMDLYSRLLRNFGLTNLGLTILA